MSLDGHLKRKLNRLAGKILLSQYFVLYLTLIYFLILSIFITRLPSPKNLKNLFSNIWPLLAVSVGQTIVFIVASIDLSQTSIMGLTSVVGAAIMTKMADPDVLSESPLWGWFLTEAGGPLAGSSWAVPVAILAMLIVGSLIGLFNGVAITLLEMPAFMVTLVSQLFFLALAIFLTKTNNIMYLPESFVALGDRGIGFIPYSMFLAGGLAVVAQLVLSRTRFGRWALAIGANRRTAIVSGVPVRRVVIMVYVFSGFCAAVASVLYSGRLRMGRPTLGSNLLMDIVGATIIGGTSMYGGKGKAIWTLFGVVFFVVLSNTLNLLKLSHFTINIVKGTVILVAALIDVTRTRLLQSRSE